MSFYPNQLVTCCQNWHIIFWCLLKKLVIQERRNKWDLESKNSRNIRIILALSIMSNQGEMFKFRIVLVLIVEYIGWRGRSKAFASFSRCWCFHWWRGISSIDDGWCYFRQRGRFDCIIDDSNMTSTWRCLSGKINSHGDFFRRKIFIGIIEMWQGKWWEQFWCRRCRCRCSRPWLLFEHSSMKSS